MPTPRTAFEHRVADVVMDALDTTAGYALDRRGRDSIRRLFESCTTEESMRLAAQSLVRCAHYVRLQPRGRTAAVELLGVLFEIVRDRPDDGGRRTHTSARSGWLSLVDSPPSEDDGASWWRRLQQ